VCLVAVGFQVGAESPLNKVGYGRRRKLAGLALSAGMGEKRHPGVSVACNKCFFLFFYEAGKALAGEIFD